MTDWRDNLAQALGSAVVATDRAHGGDLSEVHHTRLADGRVVAAKLGPQAASEARMLRAMARAGAPVPEVLHVSDGLLCLEWLPEAPASQTGWQALGTALRQMHDSHGAHYGWPEDHAFGPLPIRNHESDDWPAFWAANRLLPYCPTLPPALASRVEALAKALPDRLPARPAPALLHGDLWAGNVLFTAGGASLIDPACYHGHGEVDLAMLNLFGAPDPAFRAAYGPPAPGEDARRAIYQLWPALVHLHLFGAGYRGMVSGLLDAAGV